MTPDSILPGIPAFFAQIRQTTNLKVALGSVSKNSRLILDRIGLTNAFDAIIDGNKITRSKPDPEVFLKGAAELNVSPADCVVFEDAVAGIAAGKAGGMRTVGIGSPDVLTEADVVLPSLEHITITGLLTSLDRAAGVGY